MRAGWVPLLAATLAAVACSPNATVSRPTAPTTPAAVCPADFSGSNVISTDVQLGNGDNGRAITVHLCAVISVLLVGSETAPWRTLRSSNDSVLAVLPVPLPNPGPGSMLLWFYARATGSAVLLGSGPTHWSVAVAVVT